MDGPTGRLTELRIAVGTELSNGGVLIASRQIFKMLATKEELIVDILELFHNSVAPRLARRNKNDLNFEVKAESDQ
jgi:hypothetical protein